MSKTQWETYPEIWKDEKAFLSYLRGAFRGIWSRYPAKLKWKQQQGIVPPSSYTGRAKKLVKCACCSEYFPISQTEVDHIIECGSFDNLQESWEWFLRLIDVNDNWQLLCKPCHKIKSYAVRMGLSFEQAIIEKKIIEFNKLSATQQLEQLKAISVDASMLKTKAKRTEAYRNYLEGDIDEISSTKITRASY